MIPRVLRLRNFLSYRDETIDFSPLHMAVVTGKNGHGKSALLDAMMWAVWGKGRGGVSDDKRIRMGESDMQVHFEFEVDGQQYRIVRKRARGRALSLEMFHLGKNGTTPMTGSGVRDTQAQIEQTIGLDYDTFMNSAYVAQGRSDEFTRMGPSGRKDVLARILGLDRLEAYATESRFLKDTARQSVATLEEQIAGREEEAAQLPEAKTALGETTLRLEDLELKIDAAEAEVSGLQVMASAYTSLREETVQASKRLETEQRRLDSARRNLAALEDQIAAAEAVLASAPTVEAEYAEYRELQSENSELGEQRERWQSARRRIDRAESDIREQQARLTTQLEVDERQQREAEEQAQGLEELEAKVQEFAAQEQSFAEERAAFPARRAAIDRLRQEAAARQAECVHLKQQNREIAEKQERVQEAEGAPCPVCRKPLAPEDAAHVIEEYSNERKRLGALYKAANETALRATEQANVDAQELEGDEADVDRREKVLRQEQRTTHARLEQGRRAAESLATLRERIERTRTLLAENAFAEEARQALAAAREELDAIGYDEGRHRTVRAELNARSAIEQRHQALERATADLAIRREQHATTTAQIADYEAQVELSQKDVEERRRTLDASEDVGPRLTSAQDDLAGLRSLQKQYNREQGRLTEEVQRLQRVEASIEQARDNLRAAREEQETYATLQEAFGKNGMQAVLIDQAIPRITTHTNELLERMTGGRISVELTTQRTTKSESVVETLDIRISDNLGTRDYDLYSGGERFRVDFALRIALARLLAERAGARLPTLIIDEGFGTQDEEGVTRLIEALNAVSDEFRLVLVVTHLEQMKSHFPQRIEVTRTQMDGSVVSVSV